MNRPKPPGKNNDPWRAAAIAGVLGADLVVNLLAGYWLGGLRSNWTGGRPVWKAVGVMLGLFSGIASIVFLIKKFLEEQDG